MNGTEGFDGQQVKLLQLQLLQEKSQVSQHTPVLSNFSLSRNHQVFGTGFCY